MCPVGELPPGTAQVIEVGERRVAVFNVDGELHAVDDRCAHKGGSLAEGMVRDGIVTCPLHWWRYDLATGRRIASEAIVQATYAVGVADGEVTVDVPEERPTGSMRELLLRHAAEWKAVPDVKGSS